MPQRLPDTHYAYRIGDPQGQYPIFDATGATLAPGRWHRQHAPVIYASEHYSTARPGPVAASHGTALHPKIVSDKAQGADRSHSAVKPCNVGVQGRMD